MRNLIIREFSAPVLPDDYSMVKMTLSKKSNYCCSVDQKIGTVA